jgi:predicted MFS family arabinose efflux permease
VLACVCCLGAVFVFKNARSVVTVHRKPSSFGQVTREYLIVLDTPRGGPTMAFIFCNGAFHGGIFAWLGLLLTRRYHLHDAGIGLALAGYGLPGIFFGSTIGRWGDRYGRRYVVPFGFLWAAGCAFLLLPHSPRFVAALVITALSVGFDATHPSPASANSSRLLKRLSHRTTRPLRVKDTAAPSPEGQFGGCGIFASFASPDSVELPGPNTS